MTLYPRVAFVQGLQTYFLRQGIIFFVLPFLLINAYYSTLFLLLFGLIPATSPAHIIG